MANLGLDEMLGQLRRRREDWTIGNGGDFADEAMVVANESQVRDQRGERVPAWKGLRIDHDATQSAVLLDIRINDSGQGLEIVRLEGALRAKDEDPIVAQQFMDEHAGTYSLPQDSRRYNTIGTDRNE